MAAAQACARGAHSPCVVGHRLPPRGIRSVQPARLVPSRAPSGRSGPRLLPPCGALPDAGALNPTYVALGLTAASFLGTFLVLPRFKDQFKEDVDWKQMYAELVRAGVRSVSPEQAFAKAGKGAVLLDVRMASKYEEVHPERSVSAPLYQPIQDWDLPSNIRRAGFAFFGIYGTELNPAFLKEAQARVGKGKELLIVCESGGSLQNKPGTTFGFQSRSLKAAYFLLQGGYKKVAFVEGGVSAWGRAGLPLESGSAEPEGGLLAAVPIKWWR